MKYIGDGDNGEVSQKDEVEHSVDVLINILIFQFDKVVEGVSGV